MSGGRRLADRQLARRSLGALRAAWTAHRALARGFAWQLAGTVANQGSTFAANLVLANLLGAHDFGRFALVAGTVVAASQLAQLGVGVTAGKFLAEWRERQPERAGAVVALCLGAALALALLAGGGLALAAPLLAGRALHAPELTGALRIASVFVPAALVSGVLLGVLAGLSRFVWAGRALVASGAVYVVLCVAGGLAGGVTGGLVGMVASAALQVALLGATARRALAAAGIRPRFADALRERGLLWRFALPGALSGFTAIPALWAGSALLARHPSGPLEVARYSAAYSLAVVALFIPGVVNAVVMPRLNAAKGRGDARDLVAVYRANLRLSLSVVAAAALLVALLAEPLLGLFGPGFGAARWALYLCLLATLPETATIALNQWISTHARLWRALVQINLPRDVTIVVVAALAIPRMGAAGMAAAYLTGRVVGFVAAALLVADTPSGVEPADVRPSTAPRTAPFALPVEREGA